MTDQGLIAMGKIMSGLSVLLLAASLADPAHALTALTGDAAMVCDSGKAGYMRWSGSQFEGCDGTSWIKLAGGGIPTYAGLTTASYDGNMGGPDGINAKCAAEFPGSRVMNSTEVMSLASSMGTTAGWIFDDGIGGGTYGGCFGFSNNSSAYTAIMANKTLIAGRHCGLSFSIHCVKD